MIVIPTVIQLLPRSPYTMTVPGDNFYWPSPITAHQFHMEGVTYPRVSYALFRVQSSVVYSNSALFRLSAWDSGPTNPTPLAWVTNAHPGGGNISSDSAYFTNGLQQILDAGVPKNLGWQLAGDGTTPVTIYDVRLEIGWEVPTT